MAKRSRGEGSIFYRSDKKLWVGQITLPDGSKRTNLNGCRRIGIQSKGRDQNNLPVDIYWIDETTVSVLEEQVEKTEQDTKGASNMRGNVPSGRSVGRI